MNSSSPSSSYKTADSFTQAECEQIYKLLHKLADTVCSTGGLLYRSLESPTAILMNQLLETHGLRLVRFRESHTEWISDLNLNEQTLFVLFVAEMVLTGDIPE